MSPKYLKCKELAQRLNKYLAQNCVLLSSTDDKGGTWHINGQFVFDDDCEYIALQKGNTRIVFCGKGYGQPRISAFKSIKVCTKFFTLK